MEVSSNAARRFAVAAAALAAPLVVLANFAWPFPFPSSLIVAVSGCVLAAASAYTLARYFFPPSRQFKSKVVVGLRGGLVGFSSFVVSNALLWLFYFLVIFAAPPGVSLGDTSPAVFALVFTGFAVLWFGWLSAVIGAAIGWFSALVA